MKMIYMSPISDIVIQKNRLKFVNIFCEYIYNNIAYQRNIFSSYSYGGRL